MLPLLEVDDLFAGYASIRVLNGVSLKVQPGSITALLGSNGAGKTTLMRTIVGLIQADRGQILHEGKPIQQLPRSSASRWALSWCPKDAWSCPTSRWRKISSSALSCRVRANG